MPRMKREELKVESQNKYRPGSGRARIWEAMRGLRRFTIGDLCELTGEDYHNVKRFVRVLELAGYLRKSRAGEPGAKYRYLLVRDTGPRAPVQKAVRFLWDPNTDEYWFEDPESVREGLRALSPRQARAVDEFLEEMGHERMA